MIASFPPAAAAISLVVVPRNPFCENRRTATSMICSLRSSAAIRGEGFGSAESTLFFNVITGGFELIFFQPSSFLSTFVAKRRSPPPTLSASASLPPTPPPPPPHFSLSFSLSSAPPSLSLPPAASININPHHTQTR